MLLMSSQLLSNVGVAAVVAVCAVTAAAFVAATISVAAYVAALKVPNQMHGREPTALEWWKISHETDDGGYLDGTSTQEFMAIAETRVEERLSTLEQTRDVIETEVFNELMYHADKSNQCVVGYGYGVTRTHVFGLEAQFRKGKIAEGGVISSEVMSIKSYLVSFERKK